MYAPSIINMQPDITLFATEKQEHYYHQIATSTNR